MPDLTKNWNGAAQGTNIGKLNLVITDQSSGLVATLKFADDTYGLVVYQLTGTRADDTISFRGTPVTERTDIVQGDISVEARLTAEGTMRGTWTSTIGTGGTFYLFPFADEPDVVAGAIEQIFTDRTALGFTQIYKEDVVSIAQFMRRHFSNKKIVVTFQPSKGAERVNYFDDFIAIADLTSLTYLKMFISEPEGRGINRSMTVELRAYGINELVIQGSVETWVLGLSQSAQTFLHAYEDGIRNWLNKFLLAVQLGLLILMVIIMTSLETIGQKSTLGIVAFVAVYGAPMVFAKFFPNAVIRISNERISNFARLRQKGGSWIVLIFGALLVTVYKLYEEQLAHAIKEFFDAAFKLHLGR